MEQGDQVIKGHLIWGHLCLVSGGQVGFVEEKYCFWKIPVLGLGGMFFNVVLMLLSGLDIL